MLQQRYALDDTTKYVRDGNSKALISTDADGLKAYRAKKEKARSDQLKMKTIEGDINSLRQEMLDIKYLLQQILDKQGN